MQAQAKKRGKPVPDERRSAIDLWEASFQKIPDLYCIVSKRLRKSLGGDIS